MGVTFNSLVIPGEVLPFQPASPMLQRFPTKYAGIKGESEIIGGTGSRMVEIPMVIFGEWESAGQLQEFLNTLTDLVGTNETVEIESNAEQGPYDNCTLVDWQPVRMPLPDVAGTLDGGWFMYIMLRFIQLDTGGA